MKELSLRERLLNYMKKNHTSWVSSGELQRLVVNYTKHTPRSAVRRLQELHEEGLLERDIRKNHTWYKFSEKQGTSHATQPTPIDQETILATREYNLGDYVKVVNDPVTSVLNGMVGKVSRIEEFNGKPLYKVIAENYGPMMSGPNGDRKVRAWLKGNHRREHAEAIEKV